MEEKNYFSDSQITVTSTRIIVGATTYSLRNISSVSTAKIEPSHTIDVILIIIGILSLISGIPLIKNSGSLCIIMGILIGVAGFFIYKSKKTNYCVVLETNSGKQNVFYSIDMNYINNIVNEINNAIIDYK